MINTAISPQTSSRKQKFLSPQAYNGQFYQPNPFQRKSQSPRPFNKSNVYAEINTSQGSNFTLYEPLHSSQPRQSPSNKVLLIDQEKTNKQKTYKQEKGERSEGNENKKYSILKNPKYTDSQRTVTSQNKSLLEMSSPLFNEDKDDIFKQQKSFLKRQGQVTKKNLFLNDKTNMDFSYASFFTPTAKATNTINTGGKNKAFTTAMKALQEKIVGLENHIKKQEEEKHEYEKEKQKQEERFSELENLLKEAENKRKEYEMRMQDLDREKENWFQQVQCLQKEQDVWEKEKEALISEKKGLLKEREHWVREKEELVDMKNQLETALREKERALEENGSKIMPLEESVKRLEREQGEYKMKYGQNLQAAVLKNDALVAEIEQIKGYYDKQIKDFEAELNQIEEAHKKRVGDCELTIEGLERKGKEYEELLALKQREVDSVKKVLETHEALLEELNKRRKSVANGNEPSMRRNSLPQELQITNKRVFEDVIIENGSKSVAEVGPLTEKIEKKRDIGTNPRSFKELAPFVYNMEETKKEEGFDLQSYRSAEVNEEPRKNSIDAKIEENVEEKSAFAVINKDQKAWTPSEKNYYNHEEQNQQRKLPKTAGSRIRTEEDQRDYKGPIMRNLSEEINGFGPLQGYNQFNQPFMFLGNQSGFRNQNDLINLRDEARGSIDIAKRKTLSFGKQDTQASASFSIEGSNRKMADSVRDHLANASRLVAERKSHEVHNGRQRLIEKEEELRQANNYHTELIKKIQLSEDSMERSRMRSDLIELTNRIQKINEEIFHLKKLTSFY